MNRKGGIGEGDESGGMGKWGLERVIQIKLTQKEMNFIPVSTGNPYPAY